MVMAMAGMSGDRSTCLHVVAGPAQDLFVESIGFLVAWWSVGGWTLTWHFKVPEEIFQLLAKKVLWASCPVFGIYHYFHFFPPFFPVTRD